MERLELLEAACALLDAGQEIPDDLLAELTELLDSEELDERQDLLPAGPADSPSGQA